MSQAYAVGTQLATFYRRADRFGTHVERLGDALWCQSLLGLKCFGYAQLVGASLASIQVTLPVSGLITGGNLVHSKNWTK
jgi:hypothetical protein